MTQVGKSNQLHDLGYKIFLDRYAQKDMTRATLRIGDLVIVVVNTATGQREIGTIRASMARRSLSSCAMERWSRAIWKMSISRPRRNPDR